jgi:ABC-2 type transport system permease protein
VRKDTGWRLFLRTVLARAYPRVIGGNRTKSWIFFEVWLPGVALAAYVFVYRTIAAPPDFIGFVVLGGAMGAFWLNVIWAMGNQLYWEKETGNLALYIMAPNSLMAILVGMALGGMVTTTVRAAVLMAIGVWVFGVHFQTGHLMAVFALWLLVLVGLYGLGMIFASAFLLLGREAWHLSSLAQEPVYLLSGAYFPVKSLNVWVASAAAVVPLTLGLDAMRQLLFASGRASAFLSLRTEVAILAALAVVFLIVAGRLLGFMERLAVAEGKLTESRA